MKKCKNCGEKVQSGKTFCTNCGTTIVSEDSGGKQRSAQPSGAFFQSKLAKILVIAVVILAIASFAGYKTVQAMFKPVKVVEQFEKAIAKKNTHELAALLNSGQDEMTVSESDAAMLITYFKDNPDLLADTKESLRKTSQTIGSNQSPKDGLLIVDETAKKKWGIISQYGLSFQPIYLNVTGNQSKISVTVNSKKQGPLKKNKATFGPFLPIEHEVTGTYKGPYGTVTKSETVDPIDFESDKIAVNLDLSGENVNLYSNYGNSIVFINGKSTGKTVDELETVGPISIDGSVKIHAEITLQGKKLKSDDVRVTDPDESLELYIDDTEVIEAEEARVQAEEQAAEAREEAEEEMVDAEEEIKEVVYDHYESISYDYFSTAYDLFSSSRKEKINYSAWSKGLEHNLSNDVKNVEVTSVNGDQATAVFQMVSRDEKDNGDVLVQTFGGTWNLVKEYSVWRLAESKVKRTDSRTE